MLERLKVYMKASKIIITSGYRCREHEMEVGNKSGKGYHTTGHAVDINVWKNASERFTQKEIALALEDLNWIGGIGLINSNTAVHIDNRGSKYYFNERNANKKINNEQSFYKFYGVKSLKDIVKNKYKLSNQTMEYLMNYKYSKDLLERLSKKTAKVTDGTLQENIKQMFKFADETMIYLCSYGYSDDLLEKLFKGSSNE